MSAATIFHVDEIAFAIEPYVWAYAEAEDARIRAHWKTRLAQTPSMFDGRVLLAHRHAVLPDGAGGTVLSGGCFVTAFSRFLAWRDFGRQDLSVANLFGMAALCGSDGAFIVGEMGPHTASAGQVYFPAGTPDFSDIRDGRLDLDGSVMRELLEETGLRASDVTLEPGWTIVLRGPSIACMRLFRLDRPAAEVADDINAALAEQIEPELAAVHVISGMADACRHALPDFMLDYFRRHWSPEAGQPG